VLSAFEEAGRVRRGYFVEGLGAAQFGSTGAVDRLRASARPLGPADAPAARTVVLAAAGYPGTPRTGDVLTGAEQAGVIHAGTRRRDDGAIVSAGGRVVSITATGDSLTDARERAYALLRTVDLPGGQYRTDIAARAADGLVSA